MEVVIRRNRNSQSVEVCNRCNHLKDKIEERELECKDLKERLRESEERLNSFQNVLEPACEKIFSLSEQLEEEQKNRQDAEVLVKQVQINNVKLKRQSQTLLQNLQKFDTFSVAKLIDIQEPVDDSVETKLAETETERDLLKKKFEREKSEWNLKFKTLEEKNKEATKKLMDSLNRNEELQNLINSFKRTSNLAIHEFTKLQNQMLEEVTQKETAQQYALDCSIREKALRHQSALLVNTSSTDDKVINLMLKVEELTKELVQETESHRQEIAKMKEDLKISQDVDRLVSVQTQLEISNLEVQRLHRYIVELEKWKDDATLEMDTLRHKCEEVSIPLPAPPPPPPPPCPPPPPSIPMSVNRIKKSTSTGSNNVVVLTEASNQDKLLSDLKEMMTKMKKGDKPRSQTVRVPRKTQERELPPAIMELQSVLAKMKSKEALQTASENPPSSPVRPPVPSVPCNKPKVYRAMSKQSNSINQEGTSF